MCHKLKSDRQVYKMTMNRIVIKTLEDSCQPSWHFRSSEEARGRHLVGIDARSVKICKHVGLEPYLAYHAGAVYLFVYSTAAISRGVHRINLERKYPTSRPCPVHGGETTEDYLTSLAELGLDEPHDQSEKILQQLAALTERVAAIEARFDKRC